MTQLSDGSASLHPPWFVVKKSTPTTIICRPRAFSGLSYSQTKGSWQFMSLMTYLMCAVFLCQNFADKHDENDDVLNVFAFANSAVGASMFNHKEVMFLEDAMMKAAIIKQEKQKKPCTHKLFHNLDRRNESPTTTTNKVHDCIFFSLVSKTSGQFKNTLKEEDISLSKSVIERRLHECKY